MNSFEQDSEGLTVAAHRHITVYCQFMNGVHYDGLASFGINDALDAIFISEKKQKNCSGLLFNMTLAIMNAQHVRDFIVCSFMSGAVTSPLIKY